MIKLFRHIRKSLLMDNKTSRYFKYAIGEIILVVIGILIALQINNWNEKQKTEKAKTQVLLNLKKEFNRNLGLLGRQEDSIGKTNRNLIKLINFSASSNHTLKTDSLRYYVENMLYIYSFSIKKSVLDGLLSSGNIMLLDDELTGLLSEFSTDFDDYKELSGISNERLANSEMTKFLLEFDFFDQFFKAEYPDTNVLTHPDLIKGKMEFEALIKQSSTHTTLKELLILEITRKSWTAHLKNRVSNILEKIDEDLEETELI